MKFNANKMQDINNKLYAMKKNNPLNNIAVGIGINIKNGIEGATIYRDNWEVCNITELNRMIEELTMLKVAIEEETGIEFQGGKIMKVTNITNSRGRKVPNQFIIENGNVYTFQSYNSVIAVVDFDNSIITIGGDWNYSTTTSRYRNRFFETLGLDEMSDTASAREAIRNGEVAGYTVVYEEDLK